MSEYNPEKWVIVEQLFPKANTTLTKVLGSWYGGYLGSDSYRLSSGIEKVEEDGDFLNFTNYSGSIYRCHREMMGMSGFTASVLQGWIEQVGEENLRVLSREEAEKRIKNNDLGEVTW